MLTKPAPNIKYPVVDGMKICSKCKVNKSVDNFSIRKEMKSKYNSICKECNKHHRTIVVGDHKRKMSLEWYHANIDRARKDKRDYYWANLEKSRDRVKRYSLMVNFGISLEEYQNMLKNQDYKCAICKDPPSDNKCLSVDHNHITGQVRGLLCTKCNSAIAYLKEDKSIIQNALSYLTKYNECLSAK